MGRRKKEDTVTRAKVEPYKAKNMKGRSYKTVAPAKDMLDDDGDSMTHGPANRATKGMKRGVGSPDKQNPAKQRSCKSLVSLEEGKVRAWVNGTSKGYK
jgi:hypothetical protein